MIFLIYGLILFLYLRTWNYHLLIDDPVPRRGYLWEGPRKVHPSFYDQKRTKLQTAVNIVTHLGICSLLYVMFGWKLSLLYAVYPVNVSSVAWVTGNYYSVTTLLVLFSLYFIGNDLISSIFYFLAIYSTLSALPFVFIGMYLGNYWLIIPLIIFLSSKKFRHGIKKRLDSHKEKGLEAGEINLNRIYIVVKVIGYYIYLSIFPANLGFFHDFGRVEAAKNQLGRPTKLFWLSLVLVISYAILSWTISPLATIWFFVFIGIYSQFTTLGQFVTERYTYLSNIGFLILVAHLPQPYFEIVATLYFVKSLDYIPAWRHNLELFSHSIGSFPKTSDNYVNLASYYLENGRWQEALKPLLCAVQTTHGNKHKLHVNLANCYAKSQYYDIALYHTIEALKNCEKDKISELRDQKWDLEHKTKKMGRLRKQLAEL